MWWKFWKRKVTRSIVARGGEPVADVPRPRGVRTVLVAEEHPTVREGLRRALRSQYDLQLCAEASDGGEALLGIECHRPDVAVLDVGLPKLGGLDILRVLRERYPA